MDGWAWPGDFMKRGRRQHDDQPAGAHRAIAIALEVARQLRAVGAPLDPVIVIDTEAPRDSDAPRGRATPDGCAP